jgi:hypothetical protein
VFALSLRLIWELPGPTPMRCSIRKQTEYDHGGTKAQMKPIVGIVEGHEVRTRVRVDDTCRSVERSQRFGGWSLENVALGIEARTVQGAVPGFLRIIPMDDAAQVCADG